MADILIGEENPQNDFGEKGQKEHFTLYRFGVIRISFNQPNALISSM